MIEKLDLGKFTTLPYGYSNDIIITDKINEIIEILNTLDSRLINEFLTNPMLIASIKRLLK